MATLKNTIDFQMKYPRVYGASVEDVAKATESYLRREKHLKSQTVPLAGGAMVQGKDDGLVKSFLGLDTSLTVELRADDDFIYVKVGSGKWIQKAGVAMAGIGFAPLLLTASAGAMNQALMQQDVFDFLGRYLGVEGLSFSDDPKLASA